MNCPNCGLELKEDEKVCPICQASKDSSVEPNLNSKYEDYKEEENLKEKYGFNKLLIFSVIELVCCSQLFGLVAIVLLFLKLNTAISERNLEEVEKWAHNIKLILIIGIVVGILLGILQIGLEALPMILEMSETTI